MVIYTSNKHLYPLIYFLRNHTSSLLHLMTDLTAVDYIDRKPRFEVVYNLLSTLYNNRIRVKTVTDETTPIPTLTSIYEGLG
jgi:NADH:ubiquinone oxidoreductase subunit C